jgi:exonuclease III
MLTLASWNIDNLAPYLLPGGCPLAEVVARLGAPDILCLQEIRIRAGDTDLLDALASAVPGYRAAAAPSRDPRNAGFRGGRAYGVASLVRAELGGDIRAPDWDREGGCWCSSCPPSVWPSSTSTR